jgi:hypothetical protein
LILHRTLVVLFVFDPVKLVRLARAMSGLSSPHPAVWPFYPCRSLLSQIAFSVAFANAVLSADSVFEMITGNKA